MKINTNESLKKMWVAVHTSDFLIHLSELCREMEVKITPDQFMEIGSVILETRFSTATEDSVAAVLNLGASCEARIADLVGFFRQGLEKELKTFAQSSASERRIMYGRLHKRYNLNK